MIWDIVSVDAATLHCAVTFSVLPTVRVNAAAVDAPTTVTVPTCMCPDEDAVVARITVLNTPLITRLLDAAGTVTWMESKVVAPVFSRNVSVSPPVELARTVKLVSIVMPKGCGACKNMLPIAPVEGVRVVSVVLFATTMSV